MKLAFRIVFGLSILLNALFIYRDFCGHPDVDFYSGGMSDAYYIKSDHKGFFIIEHQGRSFLAKCQATLSWLNGITNPGEPMSDSCIYLPSLVGKSIVSGMMRHEGNTLVYVPWTEEDTVQTADVLTILSDDRMK